MVQLSLRDDDCVMRYGEMKPNGAMLALRFSTKLFANIALKKYGTYTRSAGANSLQTSCYTSYLDADFRNIHIHSLMSVSEI